MDSFIDIQELLSSLWTKPDLWQLTNGLFHGSSFRLSALENRLLGLAGLQMNPIEAEIFTVQRAALASVQRQLGGRIVILSLNARSRIPPVNQVPGSQTVARFILRKPGWKARAEVHVFDGKLVTLQFSRSIKGIDMAGVEIGVASPGGRHRSAAEVADRFEHGRTGR